MPSAFRAVAIQPSGALVEAVPCAAAALFTMAWYCLAATFRTLMV